MNEPLNRDLFTFGHYYLYLEASFIDVTRLIPLENKPNTFSPRLYEILQSACSQVENIMKIMCNELNLILTKDNSVEYYKQLNYDKVISLQQVVFKRQPFWCSINPFLCGFGCIDRDESKEHPHSGERDINMPTWWTEYNKTKHRLPAGYKAGSIKNVYFALAGSYVLLLMANQLVLKNKNILNHDCWSFSVPLKYDSYKRYYQELLWVPLRSELFISCGQFIPSCTSNKNLFAKSS